MNILHLMASILFKSLLIIVSHIVKKSNNIFVSLSLNTYLIVFVIIIVNFEPWIMRVQI